MLVSDESVLDKNFHNCVCVFRFETELRKYFVSGVLDSDEFLAEDSECGPSTISHSCTL